MYEIKFIAEAIKQAHLSQRKQRNLPGNPPNVGVVIVSDKGKVLAKAYRSERKMGQHAEFVALERKLSNIDLRGTTLYTTLEPCMDVRREEKIDCAKRIVDRGVSEVIIGILDPDIRVSAKGLLYLHENNVKVRLFPKEFEEEIKMINKQFIKSKTVTSTDEPQLSPAKGKQFHIFSFIDDLKPDPVAILSYADLLKKRAITPSIRWSTTAIKLWERAIEERTLIIQELRLAHVLYGKSNKPPFNVDWLEHFTNVIEEVEHVRRNAAFRIPKIWKGMKPFWSSILLLQHAFQPALTIVNELNKLT
jgi:pyrimidine deaminase RibD-like protein